MKKLAEEEGMGWVGHRCAGLRVLLALGLVMGSACVLIPIDVETDPLRPEPVAAARTFELVAPPWPHADVGPLIEDEIRKALSSKGLREVPLEEADIAVNYRASREQKVRIRSEPDPDTQGYKVKEQYIEKSVEIDVFATDSGDVLWRGIARVGVVSEASLPSVTARAVREILAELPSDDGPMDPE